MGDTVLPSTPRPVLLLVDVHNRSGSRSNRSPFDDYVATEEHPSCLPNTRQYRRDPARRWVAAAGW